MGPYLQSREPGMLVPERWPGPRPLAEAAEREDRTWVIARLPGASPDLHPQSELDAVSAPLSEANGMEQQSRSAAAQPRPPSAIGGRASSGSGQPAARLDPLLSRSFRARRPPGRSQIRRGFRVPRVTVLAALFWHECGTAPT
jgi:hypothetical protein